MTHGREDFYDKFVTMLKNEEEFECNFFKFKSAGFTSCCGSADTVNVVCDKLSWKHKAGSPSGST